MSYYIIIPARIGSSRLPNKPLLDIGGKPLIQRVYENALKCNAKEVIIATDDINIQKVATEFGANVCMTALTHQSGTERLLEVTQIFGLPDDAIIINVQGDEPFLPVALIQQIAVMVLQGNEPFMATAAQPVNNIEELINPNIVKVVLDFNQQALYFSRASIPYDRNQNNADYVKPQSFKNYYKHIGIYGYRVSALKTYCNWPASPLEQIEFLEQLRCLWYGRKIQVAVTTENFSHGIDTPEDLKRVQALFKVQGLTVNH